MTVALNGLPLRHAWAMWMSQWKGKQSMKFLAKFATVQEFWNTFKSSSPQDMEDKAHLHIFKDGIAPMWEDPQNVYGGHFKLTINTPEDSFELWKGVALRLIGEQFPQEACVNGISIVVHTVGENLIKVWLATADKEVVARTKEFLLGTLDASKFDSAKVTFVPHKLVLSSGNQNTAAKKKRPSELPRKPQGSYARASARDFYGAHVPTHAMNVYEGNRWFADGKENFVPVPLAAMRAEMEEDAAKMLKASKAQSLLAVDTITLPRSGQDDVPFCHDPYSPDGGYRKA